MTTFEPWKASSLLIGGKKNYGRKVGTEKEIDAFRHSSEADSTICLNLRCAREEDRKLFQPLSFSKPTVRGSFRWLWRTERSRGSHLIHVESFPSTRFMFLTGCSEF